MMLALVKNHGRALQLLQEIRNAGKEDADALFNMGVCQRELGDVGSAARTFKDYTDRFPEHSDGWIVRGDALQHLGSLQEAVAAYKAGLKLTPTDDETLKKASLCLLQLDQGSQAIDLCQEILKDHPEMLTARIGADWVLSKLVPYWHIPMMNEQERNQCRRAFKFDQLCALNFDQGLLPSRHSLVCG